MTLTYNKGEFIFGRGNHNFQVVLEDFPKANQVRILTYNISKNNYKNELIDALKSVPESADVKIVSNIPSRMQYYYNSSAGEKLKKKYRDSFMTYLERLNPEEFPSNPYVGFNFSNHAKIVGTENVVYIGSANYSDESKNNIESGTIIRDKDFIHRLYDEVFPIIMSESTPYFDDEFNVLRLFVISMEHKFKAWLTDFDDNLIVEDMNLNIRNLRQFFDFDENDFYDLAADLDEFYNLINLLENTYSEDDEEYNNLIDIIEKKVEEIPLEWMQYFLTPDSEFFNFVVFDEEERTLEYLQDDPDAYDENLDASVEVAMNKAREEYEEMRSNIEEDIFRLRDLINEITILLEETHRESLVFSHKWISDKLDNTFNS